MPPCVFLALSLGLLCSGPVLGQDTRAEIGELADLDLEALMNVRVVSAGKKEQKLSETAAAVYVITQEDIRRSGVTTLADALRMAPGVQVAQLDANKWAVSIRGFNGRFANKLLVLVDGRSVYTPLFSGVYWDVQDTMLEDVERIEVIRGPGAALWGANAVNGVINIITKKASDTRGTLLTGGGGSELQGFGGARYGGQAGENAFYRVYVKGFTRDGFVFASGEDAPDDWDMLRGGLRVDVEPSEEDALVLQGDLYDGTAGSAFTEPALAPPFIAAASTDTDVSGGHVLTRWSRTLSARSDLSLQAYFDRTERRAPTIQEDRSTFDVDFQHRFAAAPGHEVIWGTGYRYTEDDVTEVSEAFTVDPRSRGDHLVSGFVQDEIELVAERLRVIVGAKLEHNDYTGLEVQPNLRFILTPDPKQVVWGAVSRAVRTPSRAEDDFEITRAVLAGMDGAPPTALRLTGNRGFQSEELLAYELGYRFLPHERVSFDLATFLHVYDNLRSFERGAPFPQAGPRTPHVVVPLEADNKLEGESYGVELTAEYRPLDWWRLEAAYSYLDIQLGTGGGSTDSTSEEAEGQSPEHQVTLRSSFDLPGDLELDGWLRYVDRLPALDIDSYLTLDVRLGWSPRDNVEIAVVGQNLLDDRHQEFAPLILGGVPSEVERSVYAKATVTF